MTAQKITPKGYNLLGQIVANLGKLDEIDMARITGIVEGMVIKTERDKKRGEA